MLTCGSMDNAHTSTFAVITRYQVLTSGLMDNAHKSYANLCSDHLSAFCWQGVQWIVLTPLQSVIMSYASKLPNSAHALSYAMLVSR